MFNPALRALSILTSLVITFFIFGTNSSSFSAQEPTRAKAIDLLPYLTVAPELPRTGYDRENFRHWSILDQDGCDTRDYVLLAQALKAPSLGKGCALLGGQWRSIYDNLVTYRSSLFDVDHVVALAEAWDSGAALWDDKTRYSFANDLISSYSLVAVSSSSNRAKSDSDYSDWQPATKKGRCWLATATVVTKWRWSLTIDQRERSNLLSALSICPSPTIKLPPIAKINYNK
jgi:hypothetical protein